jgi:hypothetical protein
MEMEQQMADGEIHSPRPPKKYMDLGVLSASTLLYYAVVYVALSARARDFFLRKNFFHSPRPRRSPRQRPPKTELVGPAPIAHPSRPHPARRSGVRTSPLPPPLQDGGLWISQQHLRRGESLVFALTFDSSLWRPTRFSGPGPGQPTPEPASSLHPNLLNFPPHLLTTSSPQPPPSTTRTKFNRSPPTIACWVRDRTA